MNIWAFMLLSNALILVTALCVCIGLRSSRIKRAGFLVYAVLILTLILLIALNKPKPSGGHTYDCGCLAGGVPGNLRTTKNRLLRYAQKNYPSAQTLSSGDIREALENIYFVKYEIEKYALHTTKDAWWIGYDITELHRQQYDHDVPPYTFREKLLTFFDIEQDLRSNVRRELRETAEYYEASSNGTRLLGTGSLDHPPLSDDLKALYQPQDNVVWIRVK